MASTSGDYLESGRLEDVLALIQVLGIDKFSHRTERGLLDELQGPPASAKTWLDVAKAHREFFRVAGKNKDNVSLVARHVSKNAELSIEFIQELLSTAIEIHDRQYRRSQGWTLYLPVWVAALAGLVTLGATIVNVIWGHK